MSIKKDANFEKRLKLMTSGAEDLEQWMLDALREGLATLGSNDELLDDITSRMVDAKLAGIAHQITELSLKEESGWHEEALMVLGKFYLLTQGYKNFDQLPEDLKDQVLLEGGLTLRRKDLILNEGVLDDWLIINVKKGVNNDEAAFQRIWFYGQSNKQYGLFIEYDYRGIGFEYSFQLGQCIQTELVFYPGIFAQRAVLKDYKVLKNYQFELNGFENINSFLEHYSNQISANPWLNSIAVLFDSVIPVYENDEFLIVDSDNNVLTLSCEALAGWTLISMSCGATVSLFGEWNGKVFYPLSVFSGARKTDLTRFEKLGIAKKYGTSLRK